MFAQIYKFMSDDGKLFASVWFNSKTGSFYVTTEGDNFTTTVSAADLGDAERIAEYFVGNADHGED